MNCCFFVVQASVPDALVRPSLDLLGDQKQVRIQKQHGNMQRTLLGTSCEEGFYDLLISFMRFCGLQWAKFDAGCLTSTAWTLPHCFGRWSMIWLVQLHRARHSALPDERCPWCQLGEIGWGALSSSYSDTESLATLEVEIAELVADLVDSVDSVDSTVDWSETKTAWNMAFVTYVTYVTRSSTRVRSWTLKVGWDLSARCISVPTLSVWKKTHLSSFGQQRPWHNPPALRRFREMGQAKRRGLSSHVSLYMFIIVYILMNLYMFMWICLESFLLAVLHLSEHSSAFRTSRVNYSRKAPWITKNSGRQGRDSLTGCDQEDCAAARLAGPESGSRLASAKCWHLWRYS